MALSDINRTTAPSTGRPDSALARWGRRTYIAGSLTFIAVGLLHTVVQLTTLSSDDVRSAYRAGGPIELDGREVDGWELFAGISLVMGFYGMALGAANLATLAARARAGTQTAPAGVSAVNVIMLAGIAGAGYRYLGPLQSWGGLVGIGLFGLPVAAAIADRRGRASR